MPHSRVRAKARSLSVVDVRGLELAKKGKNQLTAKQSAFVAEYLIDLNATQAAIRAGYSTKRPDVIGFENLRKPVIKAAINVGLSERAKRTKVTQDTVVENIVRIGTKAETADKYGDALKAEEMLARHVKLFSDPEDNENKQPPSVTYNFITVGND